MFLRWRLGSGPGPPSCTQHAPSPGPLPHPQLSHLNTVNSKPSPTHSPVQPLHNKQPTRILLPPAPMPSWRGLGHPASLPLTQLCPPQVMPQSGQAPSQQPCPACRNEAPTELRKGTRRAQASPDGSAAAHSLPSHPQH